MDRQAWTLAEEAADLGREVATMQSGGVWVADRVSSPFLMHLSPADQRTFIANLAAGRLREAIAMVADGAMRCGIREAPALLASKRVKIVREPSGMARVEYQPQRIPPALGVLYGYAMDIKMPRAKFARLLRKGGNIQIGRMSEPIAFPALSKRDTEECLSAYPYKSKAGRPKKQKE